MTEKSDKANWVALGLLNFALAISIASRIRRLLGLTFAAVFFTKTVTPLGLVCIGAALFIELVYKPSKDYPRLAGDSVYIFLSWLGFLQVVFNRSLLRI